MIDALIKIIDRLISLVKGRIQGRKDMFEKVIDPIFNDLLLIHGDYIKMFEHAQWLLPGYSEDGSTLTAPGYNGEPEEGSEKYVKRLENAKNEIKKRRLEFEPVRAKVRIIAKSLDENKFPEEETNFIRSVLEYFPTADPISPNSATRNIIDYLDTMASRSNEVRWVIDEVIQDHKESWSNVCEAYAVLKIKINKLR